MFVQSRFKKILLTIVCIHALVFSPQAHAGKMNQQTIIGLASAGVAVTFTGKDLVMSGKNCTKGGLAAVAYCIRATFDAVQIIYTVNTIRKLLKAHDDSVCLPPQCFNGPASTEDPEKTAETVEGGGGGSHHPQMAPPPTLAPFEKLTPADVLKAIGLNLDDAMNMAGRSLEDMKARGYEYNKENNSLTTPKGTFSMSSLGSAAGMKAAGLTDAEIAALNEGQDEMKKQMDKQLAAVLAKFGADEGGGSAVAAKPEPGFNMRDFMGGNKVKPTVVGLSKSDGQGGQIGVAGDDMFGMIRRRYEDQRKKNQFNESASGVAPTAP